MTPAERRLYVLISWLLVAGFVLAVWLMGTAHVTAHVHAPVVSETVGR